MKIRNLILAALIACLPSLAEAADHFPTTSTQFQQDLTTDAACGDTIYLAASTVYSGTTAFTYSRDCTGNPITVTTNVTMPDVCDMRIASCVTSFRSYAQANFANIQTSSNNQPAITSVLAAKGWIFRGLIVSTSKTHRDGTGSELFGLGWTAVLGQVTSEADLPDGIEIDRLLVTGTTTGDSWRGIGANGKNITIKNSIVEEIHGVGIETQCVAIWNGPGPVNGENLYLNCATENWLSGGAIGGITGSIPTGSLINSYLTKKLSWKSDDPSYAGIGWTVKNNFEIKNGTGWVVTGNIIEHSWTMGQQGFCVLFTLSGDGGSWATVDNTTFEYNVVRHCNGGFQLRMSDDTNYNGNFEIGDGMTIRNNLIYDISDTNWGVGGGGGYVWLYGGGGTNQIIEHNTMDNQGRTGSELDSTNKRTSPIWRNNLSRCGTGYFSCWHSSLGGNQVMWDNWTIGGYTYSTNVHFADESQANWFSSGGNFLVAQSTFTSQFEDSANRDYRLAAGSSYNDAGTDGEDIGVTDDAWCNLPPGPWNDDGTATCGGSPPGGAAKRGRARGRFR